MIYYCNLLIITISFQLYMEMIQDLLAPEKENIPIVEDPKMRDVCVPGATVIDLKDYKSFIDLLKVGEANRAVANTKLNAESSRSHAILVVRMLWCFVICRILCTHKNGCARNFPEV